MAKPVTFVGGHSKQGVHRGVGVADAPVAAFGYCAALGEAGSVGIMKSAGLRMSFGMINMGTFFQSDVPVSVQFTLHPDPESADALWGNELAITPSDIKSTPLAYTGLKVTFGAEAGGALYIGAL